MRPESHRRTPPRNPGKKVGLAGLTCHPCVGGSYRDFVSGVSCKCTCSWQKNDKIGIQDENRRHMLMISCSFCSKVVLFDFCQNRLYESVQQFQNRRAKLVSGEFFMISEDRVGGKSCSCLLICLLFIFFRNGIFQI